MARLFLAWYTAEAISATCSSPSSVSSIEHFKNAKPRPSRTSSPVSAQHHQQEWGEFRPSTLPWLVRCSRRSSSRGWEQLWREGLVAAPCTCEELLQPALSLEDKRHAAFHLKKKNNGALSLSNTAFLPPPDRKAWPGLVEPHQSGSGDDCDHVCETVCVCWERGGGGGGRASVPLSQAYARPIAKACSPSRGGGPGHKPDKLELPEVALGGDLTDVTANNAAQGRCLDLVSARAFKGGETRRGSRGALPFIVTWKSIPSSRETSPSRVYLDPKGSSQGSLRHGSALLWSPPVFAPCRHTGQKPPSTQARQHAAPTCPKRRRPSCCPS